MTKLGKLVAYLKEWEKENKEEIYLIGATVRDFLLKRETSYFDFSLKLMAEKAAKEIKKHLGGILHIEGEEYKVYIKEGNITLSFRNRREKEIEEVLKNRVFTIDAMAFKVEDYFDLTEEKILDFFQGIKDLKNKAIRHTDKAVFEKNPINMVKAVSLMSLLEWDIDEESEQLIRENAALLSSSCFKEIGEEVFKILKSHRSYYYFSLMDKHLHILDKIFPEIIPMKSVGECKYHVVDSLTHSIYTLKIAENVIHSNGFFEDHVKKAYEVHCSEKIGENRTRLDLIKLGALFHDIGKPGARKVDETGRVRFRGHEIIGAQILRNIAQRFELSDEEKNILYKYAALHMGPLVLYRNNDVSGMSLYKMFSEGKNETLDILLIGYADIVATRKLLDPEEEMGMFKVHIEYIANNYITRYKELEDISDMITGREILDLLKGNFVHLTPNIIEEVKKGIYLGKIPRDKNRVIEYIKKIVE